MKEEQKMVGKNNSKPNAAMSYADARRFQIIIIVSRKDCNSQFISLGSWTILLGFGDRF